MPDISDLFEVTDNPERRAPPAGAVTVGRESVTFRIAAGELRAGLHTVERMLAYHGELRLPHALAAALQMLAQEAMSRRGFGPGDMLDAFELALGWALHPLDPEERQTVLVEMFASILMHAAEHAAPPQTSA
jgi:hypothetical protein